MSAYVAFLTAMLATPLASNVGQDAAREAGDPIIVTGQRAELAATAADQAVAITQRPPTDVPLPRRYAPVCVKLFGIDQACGARVAERIRQNLTVLGLPKGQRGCAPNVWIGFLQDSKNQVARLRKQQPAMFETLKAYEIERIFAGSGAVQVWHATEVRSADGRPIPIVQLDVGGAGGTANGRPIETGYNAQYTTGRLASTIRNDINATIVVFDRARANGRTVQQLADYATFRILAPVQDEATAEPGAAPSILQLFAQGADPVEGLTEFDWAYLSAYYSLDRRARASAVHDATRRTMLDGTGQRLREKAEAE